MIAVGADHGGYKLKEEIKKYLDELGLEYKDFGCYDETRTDYPIYAKKVAEEVSSKRCELGILVCRSGAGMTIVANKFKGVRAANFTNEEETRLSKADDDINIAVFGGDYITPNEAIRMLRIWIATEFKGGRYEDRLQMIENIENNEMK